MSQDNQGGVFESAIKNFLAPIWDLLKDESVTEVMVNRHDEIWIEKAGKVHKSEACFPDEDSVRGGRQ